ncbi:MAG: hypothetical protein WDN00_00885 [Limisphaerales bacterium]
MPQALSSSQQSSFPRHFTRLHLTESLNRLGGVETLVKLMVRHDPASAVISLLDYGEPNDGQLFRLRSNFLTSAVAGRRRVRHPALSADVLIFHNYSGMMLLSSNIAHQRAVLYLHTNSDDVFEILPATIGIPGRHHHERPQLSRGIEAKNSRLYCAGHPAGISLERKLFCGRTGGRTERSDDRIFGSSGNRTKTSGAARGILRLFGSLKN